MGSRIWNSLWLMAVDPHRGGSISLRPDDVWLEMHPQDAAARHLQEGMRVRMWNDLGEVHLPLRITPHVRPGVVCSAKGAWLRTSDNGQTVSALAPSHYADLCEGACYNDARVEVVPLYLSL